VISHLENNGHSSGGRKDAKFFTNTYLPYRGAGLRRAAERQNQYRQSIKQLGAQKMWFLINTGANAKLILTMNKPYKQ